jgi:hypothetical protein
MEVTKKRKEENIMHETNKDITIELTFIAPEHTEVEKATVAFLSTTEAAVIKLVKRALGMKKKKRAAAVRDVSVSTNSAVINLIDDLHFTVYLGDPQAMVDEFEEINLSIDRIVDLYETVKGQL